MQEVPLSDVEAKKHDSLSASDPEEVDLEASTQPPTLEVKPPSAASQQSSSNIRLMALVGLVIQNSALILTMKQASLTPSQDGKKALTSTVVVMVETFKVIACSMEIGTRRGGLGGFVDEVREEILGKPHESMMLLVPSLLYLAQNNLLFVAVANLEAVVYQVVSQAKILTTAVFSILILQRKLSVQQWIALVVLTIGCAVVQTDGTSSSSQDPRDGTSPTLGLICAFCAICTSGLAGVYCEKMLKSGSSNMSIRNIQLGVPALTFGLVGALMSDGGKVIGDGFFQGYTYLTVLVIILHAGGGLLVTVIMKYADNIAKTIAVAVSLVVSTAASIYLFDFVLTFQFISGASLVICATCLYSNLVPVCA